MIDNDEPMSLWDATAGAIDDIAAQACGDLDRFERLKIFFQRETAHVPAFVLDRIHQAVVDYHKVCESHIEVLALAKIMAFNVAFDGRPPHYPTVLAGISDSSNGNVTLTPQVNLGQYRADFLVRGGANSFIVECDGKAFHDSAADAIRDAEIERQFNLKTFRLTGREIWMSNGWLTYFGCWCRGDMFSRDRDIWLQRLEKVVK